MSSAPRRTIWGLVASGAVFVYPFAVYAALRAGHSDWVGLILIGLMLPAALQRLWALERQARWVLLRGPFLAVAVIVVAGLRGDVRYTLAIPALVNLSLLGAFAASLRRGEQSIIEHLARAQLPHREFGPEHVRYCRGVTITWCVFFTINGIAAALLAAFAPYSWWALGTGPLSYLAIGLLFAIEYCVRKYRFRLFGERWYDRLLARLLPPSTGARRA